MHAGQEIGERRDIFSILHNLLTLLPYPAQPSDRVPQCRCGPVLAQNESTRSSVHSFPRIFQPALLSGIKTRKKSMHSPCFPNRVLAREISVISVIEKNGWERRQMPPTVFPKAVLQAWPSFCCAPQRLQTWSRPTVSHAPILDGATVRP